MGFYVYILASCRNGTLYIGMTDDLLRRVWEHQTGAAAGFTRKYGVKMLVWFERHESRESACGSASSRSGTGAGSSS
jgi:putative endonuclease